MKVSTHWFYFYRSTSWLFSIYNSSETFLSFSWKYFPCFISY